MPRSRTTSLTCFLGSESAPVAYRVTLFSDGLFRRLGSRTIVDHGDDPASWSVWTSDHVMNVAMNDQDGFMLSKGTTSNNKLAASTHEWKESVSLGKMLASSHPLVATLRGVTIETIRDAYAAYRRLITGEDAVEELPEA